MPSQKVLIAKYLDIISAVLSSVFNAILIFLILTRSPSQFGTYKYLMVFISIFEVIMAAMEAVLVPIHYSHGSVIIVMVHVPSTPFPFPLISLLHLIFLGLFGASLGIFALHFIYRYLAVSGNSLLKTFDSWKIFLWFQLPISSGFAWSLAANFLCEPDIESNEYLREGVSRDFGEDIEDYDYRLFYLYKRSADGGITFNSESLMAIGITFFPVALSLFLILFFGFKCYHHISSLMNKSTNTSYQFRIIQSQLFYALVVQTLIPVLLVHIPTALIFLITLFEIDAGDNVAFASMFFALYFAIDPFPNFFIIKAYRRAIFDYIRCRKPEPEVPSVNMWSSISRRL